MGSHQSDRLAQVQYRHSDSEIYVYSWHQESHYLLKTGYFLWLKEQILLLKYFHQQYRFHVWRAYHKEWPSYLSQMPFLMSDRQYLLAIVSLILFTTILLFKTRGLKMVWLSSLKVFAYSSIFRTQQLLLRTSASQV